MVSLEADWLILHIYGYFSLNRLRKQVSAQNIPHALIVLIYQEWDHKQREQAEDWVYNLITCTDVIKSCDAIYNLKFYASANFKI